MSCKYKPILDGMGVCWGVERVDDIIELPYTVKIRRIK